jgi:hypothetical protein
VRWVHLQLAAIRQVGHASGWVVVLVSRGRGGFGVTVAGGPHVRCWKLEWFSTY